MVPEVAFTGLVVVAAAAFLAPLLLGLVPAVRLPAVVLELVIGIAIGPHGFGWVALEAPIEVLSLLGLAFLLFLAGLDIELDRLRGRLLQVTAAGFALSCALAVGAGYVLGGVGLVETPLLVAIILLSTSLGVVIPVLKDAGHVRSQVGQLTIAGATIADFGAIILLSLLFSRDATGTGTRLVLIAGFVGLAAVVAVTAARAGRSGRVMAALLRLQDTTAQIRVRGAFLLLVGVAALAETLGLETILGAFFAGVILTLVDRDRAMTHPRFRAKLEAVGFGVFVPIFFVASGMALDLPALVADGSTLTLVPVFLLALLLVRGLPGLLYAPLVGGRRAVAAGLLQATSLPFIVATARIGVELGRLDDAMAAALTAAGLLSVLGFPLGALLLLGRDGAAEPAETTALVSPPAAREETRTLAVGAATDDKEAW